MNIQIGDVLYFWNRVSNCTDSIVVTAISSDNIGFQFQYRDELFKMLFSKAEGYLFHSSFLASSLFGHESPYVDGVEPRIADSCDTCQLKKSEQCTRIGNKLCEDYRAAPLVPFNQRHGIRK